MSIADRFATELGATPIEQLVVISPYWDGGLIAQPGKVILLQVPEMLVGVDNRNIGRKTGKGHGGILLILHGPEKAGHLTGWNESVRLKFKGRGTI